MAAEPKGGKVTRKADGTTVLPDGSAFCTMTVPTKKACTPVAEWNDQPFAAEYMKTAGLRDILSQGRTAFHAPGPSGVSPMQVAGHGAMAGSVLGGAADLAAATFNPAHPFGVGPAIGAGISALPGLALGAGRFVNRVIGRRP